MKIDFPIPSQYGALAALWKEAFGDSEEFIDGFFYAGFSPSRCRCVTEDGEVIAALYWFDVTYRDQRFAYLYAVATAQAHRGKGICRTLLEDTHAHLKLRGYDGVLLVPETESLRQMYGRFGYVPQTSIREFSRAHSDWAVQLQRIDRDEYAALRRQYLPEGGALQEEESIAYLEMMAFFYSGDEFVLAAQAEGGKLRCPEILGDTTAAPGILMALNCTEGTFRTPGGEKPFAMFLPLVKDAQAPDYLGLAFD